VQRSEDQNEPYTRWQGFRINQLGLCISLFLTFAVAVLGFSINLLVQPKYEITAPFARILFLCSLLGGSFSVVCGSAACVVRLWDFRDTSRVVRHHLDPEKKVDVECWRANSKKYGCWTWRLFYWQLRMFFLQALGLVLALGITYWGRLTPLALINAVYPP